MFIWFGVIILASMFVENIRKSIWSLLKIQTQRFFVRLISIMTIYCLLLIYLLHSIGFWEPILTKNTLFWFFGTAFVLVFKAHEMKSMKDFRIVLRRNIKLTAILEFIGNLYVFPFWAEFIMVPLLLFFTLIQSFAKRSKYHSVSNNSHIWYRFSQDIILIFSSIAIIFTFYKSIMHYHELFTIGHIKELLIPAILTILFIPFIYLFAFYMTSEALFAMVNHSLKDKSVSKSIIWKIVRLSEFNIDLLYRLDKGVRVYSDWNEQGMIRYVNRVKYFIKRKNNFRQPITSANDV